MPAPVKRNHADYASLLEHDDTSSPETKRVLLYGWDSAAQQKVRVAVNNEGVLTQSYGDSANVDAFGRLRVSDQFTLFDSKQIHDNQPLFWDDQETSGSGTTSTHSTARASTKIGLSATTAGTRVRQTFQRFNYQPGKSQQFFLTFVDITTETGNTKCLGCFDDDNGIYLESSDGVLYAVRRSSVTGSPVDTKVAQSSWNVDKMDGTGRSGINIDTDTSNILIIDYEWLGVGRVRMGFVVDGQIYYFHTFNNANNLESVYMSVPNLPIRYHIVNDGTGPADTFEQVCSSAISEGGQQTNGVLRHYDSGSVSGLSSGTLYALIGLRLQSGKLTGAVDLEGLSVISTTGNDKAHWELIFNPTVAGTFTYSNQTNSVVQTATGSSTNTITGGTAIDGGYFTEQLPVSNTIPNALRLGASIAGTVDTVVLAVKPITNNITVEGSLTWRELS